MVAQVSITVANVADLLSAGHTHIEVWRSVDEGNLYHEVTDEVAGPAVLESVDASNTYRVGGRSLRLQIDGGAEYSIEFGVLVEYWTPAQVAARINEVFVDLASVSDDGKRVLLTSPSVGRNSSITVLYNDAHELGLYVGQKVVGKEERIPLSLDSLIYTFTDVAGRSSDRYKWRFSANGVDPTSEFSERVLGKSPPVDSDLVAIGTAQFLGLDGRPQKRTVIIGAESTPSLHGGFAVGSLPMVVHSDDNGFVQVPLVRGAKVRVAVEGTSFVREIEVPDQDAFDLLTAMATAPDPFSVQTPLPFLVRRSI